MKIEKLIFNWRQVGTTLDNSGAGEDYDWFTVGEKDVVSIEESSKDSILSYYVTMLDGNVYRIFNPNIVEYKK